MTKQYERHVPRILRQRACRSYGKFHSPSEHSLSKATPWRLERAGENLYFLVGRAPQVVREVACVRHSLDEPPDPVVASANQPLPLRRLAPRARGFTFLLRSCCGAVVAPPSSAKRTLAPL